MFEDVLLASVPPRDLPLVERFLPGAQVTSAPLSPGLVAAHPHVRVLAVTVHDPVSPELLALLPDLVGVVTRSTGHDHLPLSWMQERGVAACTLGDYAVSSVVQLTVAMVLSLLRRVPEAMAVTQGARRGGRDPPLWDRSALVGRNLEEVTVGVLGTGRIGGRVVRALSGLGAVVTGHDIRPDPTLAGLPNFRYVDPLPRFLEGADVLTVHVPLDPSTRHLIDRAALQRLPPGALLVNTARGRVVDQLAVERALRSGRLGGYAADVLPGEPQPPLLSHFQDITKVLITPHLGAYDTRAIQARYRHTAEAARALLAGDAAALAPYRVTHP